MKPNSTLRSYLALAGSSLLAISSSHAATIIWDTDLITSGVQEATGTFTWAAADAKFWNGSGNVATTDDTTTDIAQFGNGATLASSPTINVSTQSIGGLIFGATTTRGYTLSASSPGEALTIGGSGITVNTGAQATTVGSANLGIILGAAQSWTNNSATLLTIGGAVTNGSNLLTIGGTGNTTVSGAIGNGAGGLTKSGAGTLTLSGANTYTGTTTINAGTIQVGTGTVGSLNGIIGTALTFGGTGTFNVRKAAGVSQGMGVLTLSGGDATITSTWNNGAGFGNTAVTFDSLAARSAGATVNFTLAGTGSTATNNRISLTSTTNAPLKTTSNNAGMFFGGNSYTRYDAGTNTFGAVIYGTDSNANASLSGNANTTLGTIGASKDAQFVGAATTTSLGTAQAAGLTTMTVADGTAFKVGQLITGAGIAADTIVTGIALNVLTLSQPTSGAITATQYTPYTSISAQTTDSLNTLNLSGPGATLTLDAGQTLSVNGILRTAGTAAAVGSINGGTGIQTVDSGGEMVIRTDLTTDVLHIRTPILANGASSLTKSGAGTLTLSGNSTYTGITTINAGNLTIAHNNALGATAGNTIFGTGALQLLFQRNITNNSIGIDSPENFTFYNSGAIIFNNSGRSSTLSGNIILASPAGAITLSTANGGSKLVFAGTISQTGTSRDLILSTPSSGGQGITINNPIANNGGRLLITGGSASLLIGVNATDGTGIGETVISSAAGTLAHLKLGVSNALNTTANLTIGSTVGGTNDGKFDLASFSQTVNALIGNGTTATNSTRTVFSSVNGTSTLTVGNGGGSGTFNGTILNTDGTKIVALIKTGTGTQTLTGANTYTGGTQITGGTLLLSGAVNMPSTGTLALSAGGNFSLADGTIRNTTAATLTLATGSLLTFDWSSAGTVDNLAPTAAITPAASTTVGIIINPIGTPTGGGNLLTGIAGSTLDNPNYFLANNTNFTATITKPGAGPGSVSIGSYAAVSALTEAYWKRNQVADATDTMAFSSGTTSNWASDAAGTAAGGVVPGGSGVNVIFGATTASSTVTVGANMNLGSITFNDTAEVTLSGNSLITLNNTSSTAATTGSALSTITNAGANAISAITVTQYSSTTTNTNTISANIALGANQTWNIASGKTLLVSGAVGGASSLTKADAGTLTLSGANNYTGTTTISNGTLLINGNQFTATGAVSVAASATLGGNGTVGGATTFTGASIHAPGSAAATVGTQAFSSSLTYGTGTIFNWDFDSVSAADPGVVTNAATGTYDKVTAGRAITGGAAVFKIVLAGGDSFTDAFWNTDKSWSDIFTGGTGSATNLAALFTSFDATGGLDSTGLVTGEGQFAFSNVSNTLTWTASLVPEPTSALAGLLLGAGLLRRRRTH